MSLAAKCLAALLVALAFAITMVGSAVLNDWLFRVATLVMLAVSWNLMANAGLVSLGHSAFWGIGSYATVLSANTLGLPFGVAFVPAVVVGALLGVLLALTTGRLKGIFFAIATLALSEGLRVLALMLPEVTGGAVGLFLIGEARPSLRVLYVTGLVGAIAAVAVAAYLSSTRFHYACRGMRANEAAVQMLGVDPRRYRLGVMAISGAMASTAGAIYAWYGGYLEPDIAFSLHYTILAQIAPILGGVHTIVGAVTGSFAIVFLSEGTRITLGGSEGWSLLVYGLVLVVCILFMPRGIYGSVLSLVRGGRRTLTRRTAASGKTGLAAAPGKAS